MSLKVLHHHTIPFQGGSERRAGRAGGLSIRQVVVQEQEAAWHSALRLLQRPAQTHWRELHQTLLHQGKTNVPNPSYPPNPHAVPSFQNDESLKAAEKILREWRAELK